MSTTRRLAAIRAADAAGHPWRARPVRDSLDLVFEVEEQRVEEIVRPAHVYYP